MREFVVILNSETGETVSQASFVLYRTSADSSLPTDDTIDMLLIDLKDVGIGEVLPSGHVMMNRPNSRVATAVSVDAADLSSERLVTVAQRFGDAPRIIGIVADTLERTFESGTGLLPESEAEYVARHSGLEDPESGPGSDDYAVLVARQAVIDEAAFVSTAQAAELLGVDPSRVRHRQSAGQLIGERFGRELRYPLWQFDTRVSPAVPIPHLRAVAEAIRPSVHPAEVAGIMGTEQEDLTLGGKPVSPREWLLSGGSPEPVMDVLAADVEW